MIQSILSKPRQRYIKSKEEQHVLQLVSWPAPSADLNPIELMWDELDQNVRAKENLLSGGSHFDESTV